MIKSLHYKFGIGDKVKLIKKPSDSSSISVRARFDNVLPQETYEINGWGWIEEEPGVFKQYYRLSAYCNRYLNFDNRISEDEIIGVGETHPFDDSELVYKSVNGDDVTIGMTGYNNIYYGGENDDYISPDFTFTSWGTVQKIQKFVEEGLTTKYVIMSEEVESQYNPEKGHYEARQTDGRLRNYFPYLMLTKVDKNFVKEYVAALGKRRMKSALTDKKYHDYYLIKSWLEMMNVYDDAVKLATRGSKNNSSETKRKSCKKSKKDKLEELLKGLSEEDKKRLKEML